jgi:hypothetical protein
LLSGSEITQDRVRTTLSGLIRQQIAAGIPFKTKALSKSMAPLIQVGDYLQIGWKDPSCVQTGDIVAISTQRGFRVHRVRSLLRYQETLSFITQGDLSLGPDMPLAAEDYLGVVTAIESGSTTIDLGSRRGILRSRFCFAVARVAVLWHRLKVRARALAISCADVPILSQLFHIYYRLAATSVRLIAWGRGESVLVRRSFAWGDWSAGSSDIDLCWQVKKLESAAIQRVWSLCTQSRRVFPVLGEVFLTDATDLEFWTRYAARGMESRFWNPPFLKASYIEHPIKYPLDLFVRVEHGVELLSSILWRRYSGLATKSGDSLLIRKAVVDILSFDWFASLPYREFHPSRSRLMGMPEFALRYAQVLEHLHSGASDSVEGISKTLALCLRAIDLQSRALVSKLVLEGSEAGGSENCLFVDLEHWTENVFQALEKEKPRWLFQQSEPTFFSASVRPLRALRNPLLLPQSDPVLYQLLLRGHLANLLPTLCSPCGYLLDDLQTRRQLVLHLEALRKSVVGGELDADKNTLSARWLEETLPQLLQIKNELLALFRNSPPKSGLVQ